MHRYTMRLTWIEGAYSVVGFRGQPRNSGKDNCRELAELILTVGNSELRIHCGQSVMRKFINDGAVVIAISLSFFAFGFVLGMRVFDLNYQEVIARSLRVRSAASPYYS